jgi:hypothetical protein
MDGPKLPTGYQRRGRWGGLIGSLAASMVAFGVPSPAAAETVTFANAAVGAAPENFDFARTGQGSPGQWAIVADAGAEAGRALEQTSSEQTDYRFPLAVYRPLTAKNVEVSVRFKPVAGRLDRAGGIALRLANADNYYVARANALENNVRFYRVVNGRRMQLKSANAKVAADAWHTLGVRAEGERFTVSFDGKPLYTVSDKTFATAGKVALWTKADSVTRFDRLDVTPFD